jgi:PEP-CTERM motif
MREGLGTMKKVLRSTLVVVFAALALPSTSFASILCDGTPTSISVIIAGGGCQFGSNLFTNVSIAASNEFAASPDAIDPTKVQLAFTGATSNPGVVNVVVSNANAASWALAGPMQFALNLTYTVTGSAPYFTQFADSFNGTSTGAGEISFDKAANGQILPTLVTPSSSNAPMSLGGTIQTFNVTDNIQVHASNASATLINATDSFTMVATAPVPEPTTLLLVGSGLAAFGALRFRRRG